MKKYRREKKSYIKDETINIRVTKGEKEIIQNNADCIGIPVSKYIVETLISKKNLVSLEGGKELANAIYDMNETLKHYEKCPLIPVDEIRNAIDKCIIIINKIMTGEI